MSYVSVGIRRDLHKKLKIEAINQDKQLRELIAEILEEYIKNKEK